MFRLLIQRYAQFWFFRKGSGTSFSIIFCVLFFKKNNSYLIIYKLTKFLQQTFTSWLLGNICISIICFPVYDVSNFKINLSLTFLSSRFSTWPKKSDQKFKYLYKLTKFLRQTFTSWYIRQYMCFNYLFPNLRRLKF